MNYQFLSLGRWNLCTCLSLCMCPICHEYSSKRIWNTGRGVCNGHCFVNCIGCCFKFKCKKSIYGRCSGIFPGVLGGSGGLEIASVRVLTGGCAASPTSLLLEGYTLTFSCQMINVEEEPDAYQMYEITVRARKGAWSNQTFVSKTVRRVLTEF